MNIFVVSIIALLVNIPLGHWRCRYSKYTLRWWLLIHASIPIVITVRIWLGTPKVLIPFFIGLAVLGQLIGTRYYPKNE